MRLTSAPPSAPPLTAAQTRPFGPIGNGGGVGSGPLVRNMLRLNVGHGASPSAVPVVNNATTMSSPPSIRRSPLASPTLTAAITVCPSISATVGVPYDGNSVAP